MFSVKEKRHIADVLEKLLLTLNHPEMPNVKPYFVLKVLGKEDWSYAEIRPNWVVTDTSNANPFNEISREVLKKD